MNISAKKGVTLAEVMVALTILAIIVPLSIPVIITTFDTSQFRNKLKKSVKSLNESMYYSIGNLYVDASTCSGCSDSGGASSLATFFQRGLAGSNISATDNAVLLTPDGFTYTFNKNTANACGTNANLDHTAADCFVMVDLNGSQGPNTFSDGSTFKDRFFLVINADSVEPSTAFNRAAVKAIE